jgi:hypothetical protein
MPSAFTVDVVPQQKEGVAKNPCDFKKPLRFTFQVETVSVSNPVGDEVVTAGAPNTKERISPG